MYQLEVESKKDIWVYKDSHLLGKLIWRSEDETHAEFLSGYSDKLIHVNDIDNREVLPSFLDDNIFAIQ